MQIQTVLPVKFPQNSLTSPALSARSGAAVGLDRALVTAAASLAARHAGAAERDRTLSREVAAALIRAGFARHFVPRAFGGTAGAFAELLDAVAEVGESCAAAAWWAALQAAHGRLAAHLPPPVLAELWSESPDIPVAAAVVPPAGELTAGPGGHRLSGRWSFASGVDHADWILLSTTENTVDGPRLRIVAVPRQDIDIHDTWDSCGLRGTGSHSLTVTDAHIPAHRTVPREQVEGGLADEEAARCHRIPYALVASLLFAAPALGAARGALRAWTELTLARTTAAGRPALEDGTAQQILARSSAEIDAAQLLLERAALRADTAALQAPPTALNQRDCAVAIDMLVTAVERLLRSGGARAQAPDSALQRLWRDIHAAAGHAAVQLPPAAAAYSRHVLAGQAR